MTTMPILAGTIAEIVMDGLYEWLRASLISLSPVSKHSAVRLWSSSHSQNEFLHSMWLLTAQTQGGSDGTVILSLHLKRTCTLWLVLSPLPSPKERAWLVCWRKRTMWNRAKWHQEPCFTEYKAEEVLCNYSSKPEGRDIGESYRKESIVIFTEALPKWCFLEMGFWVRKKAVSIQSASYQSSLVCLDPCLWPGVWERGASNLYFLWIQQPEYLAYIQGFETTRRTGSLHTVRQAVCTENVYGMPAIYLTW